MKRDPVYNVKLFQPLVVPTSKMAWIKTQKQKAASELAAFCFCAF